MSTDTLKLTKIGNSLGFTLPKNLRQQLGIQDHIHSFVRYKVQGKKLIIEADEVPSIDTLVKLMDPKKPTQEVDWGKAVGEEFC